MPRQEVVPLAVTEAGSAGVASLRDGAGPIDSERSPGRGSEDLKNLQRLTPFDGHVSDHVPMAPQLIALDAQHSHPRTVRSIDQTSQGFTPQVSQPRPHSAATQIDVASPEDLSILPRVTQVRLVHVLDPGRSQRRTQRLSGEAGLPAGRVQSNVEELGDPGTGQPINECCCREPLVTDAVDPSGHRPIVTDRRRDWQPTSSSRQGRWHRPPRVRRRRRARSVANTTATSGARPIDVKLHRSPEQLPIHEQRHPLILGTTACRR